MYMFASGLCIYVVVKDYNSIYHYSEEACFWSPEKKNRPWVAVLIGSLCGVPPGIFVYYIVKWTVRSSMEGFRSWKLYIFYIANFSFFGLAVTVAFDEMFWKSSGESTDRLDMETTCVDMAVASCMAVIQLTMIPAFLSSCSCNSRFSFTFSRKSIEGPFDLNSEFIPENGPMTEPMVDEASRSNWNVSSKRSGTGASDISGNSVDYSSSYPKDHGTISDVGPSSRSQRLQQTFNSGVTLLLKEPSPPIIIDNFMAKPSPYPEMKNESKLDREDLRV